MAHGSVITTHLLTGEPQGLRRVFMKNKTCEMYVIPRALISEAETNEDLNLNQPGIYILLEDLNISDVFKPKAYIGHSEDVGNRIDQHLIDCAKDGKNDFFSVVLVFVSTDHSINKADVQYLEAKAIESAKKADRYDTSNSVKGTVPHLSPDQRDVVEEFREYVWLLTSFLGCKIFVKPVVTKSANQTPAGNHFSLMWGGITATAQYAGGDMIIKKGSQIRKKTVVSANPEKRQARLSSLPVKDIDSDRYELTEDISASSPSLAAWIVSGTSLNGWEYWRNSKGQTLDQVFRKQIL